MASSSPRLVGLYITLFIASAIITFSLRQTPHSGHVLPGWRLNAAHSQSQKPLDTPKLAFATFLGGIAEQPATGPDMPDDDDINDNDDGYYVSTRVLAYQLLHSKTAGTNRSIPFVVLCTEQVSQRKRDRLAKDGATVVLVQAVESDWVQPGAARWRDMLTKLRLFQLTDWQKICYIDADTLVTGPLDGIFFDEATLTQATQPAAEGLRDDEAPLPRTYIFAAHSDLFAYDHPYPPPADMAYLNAGFFVYSPSAILFEYYLSLLRLPGRFDPAFADQSLLNYAHRRAGNMPWKPLWYGWNVNWPTARDWQGGARSFHDKYWDGDPSHDPVLKAIWKEQRAEMEGFYRGRDAAHQ